MIHVALPLYNLQGRGLFKDPSGHLANTFQLTSKPSSALRQTVCVRAGCAPLKKESLFLKPLTTLSKVSLHYIYLWLSTFMQYKFKNVIVTSQRIF